MKVKSSNCSQHSYMVLEAVLDSVSPRPNLPLWWQPGSADTTARLRRVVHSLKERLKSRVVSHRSLREVFGVP